MTLRPLVLMLLVAGCSTKSTFGTDAGEDAAVIDDDGGITLPPSDSGNEAGETRGCSPDLRQVLDGSGNIIETCPPDQGCAGGVCVPACDAAGAAKGSVGCDFMVATPSFFAGLYPSYFGPCFSVMLANNWPKDVTVSISRAGQTFDPTKYGRIAESGVSPASWAAIPSKGIPPGKVGVLFLEHTESVSFKCPITPALSTVATSAQVQGTGRGKAWHIQTGVPVTGYDMLPFGGAPSVLPGATLLLPTSAWGVNYVAAVPQLGSGAAKGYQGGPHWGQIVATEDGTVVQIVPTIALPSGTSVSAAPFNVTTTYNLNAGEYVQWQGPFDYSANPTSVSMDMSGSILSSNKPIAFNGGNGYLCLGSSTSTGGGCDSDHEQIPPVSALGFEYAVAPYTSRLTTGEEAILYRFVGVADGTTLTYDPAVPGAPTTLKLGKMVEFEAKGAFIVKSQDSVHPFHVAQMMTGCTVTPSNGCIGDEDYTNVLPPAQFLGKYVFFTDLTYDSTNLVLVRKKIGSGFKDVDIDCIGNVSKWKPMGSSGEYEYSSVDLVRDKVSLGKNCQNGPHTATSTGPFGVTVWGLSGAASYSYPAGGNVASINTVVIPPTPIK